MPSEEQAGPAVLRLRSSVRMPWLCTGLTLLLLSGAAFVALDRPVSTGAVPAAVLGSQTHLTEEYAQGLAEQYQRDGQYAAEVAGQLNASPDINQTSYFSGLAGRTHPWTSLELIDTAQHKVVAGAGNIDQPAADELTKLRLPSQTEREIIAEDGSGVLRISVPLESSPQVLVLTASLGLTTSGGAQAALVNEDGETVSGVGKSLAAAASVRPRALRSAADGHSGAITAGLGTSSPAVLSYAPIDLTAALNNTAEQTVNPTGVEDEIDNLGLGLLVERPVSVAHATGIGESEQTRLALAAGLGMLAIALFAASMLWFGIIGPVRRLARQSAEIPAVGVLDLPSFSGEARDLGRNMHKLAIEFSTEASPVRRAAVPGSLWARATSGVVVLCVALAPVLAWAVAVTYEVYQTAPVVVPSQVAVDQGHSTSVLAASLQARLAAAGQDLSTVAVAAQTDVAGDGSTPTGGNNSNQITIASPARLETLVETLTAATPAYSSVYVVDTTGKVLALAGSSPRASVKAGGSTKATAATLVEGATSGRTALLYSVLPIGSGASVVAEFSDAQLLTAVQHDSLGAVNFVDGQNRVLMSNASFTAYTALSGPEATAATTARAQGRQGVGGHVDADAIVQAGTVAPDSTLFAVTTERATSKIAVSGVVLRQTVQLLALLAITTALLCGGWILFMVLMPLRRLERRARQVVDGDYSEAVIAQRADEIGQLSRSLDLLRRAARRGRGEPVPVGVTTASAWSETSLLPKFPGTGAKSPVGAPRSPGDDETRVRRRSDRVK